MVKRDVGQARNVTASSQSSTLGRSESTADDDGRLSPSSCVDIQANVAGERSKCLGRLPRASASTEMRQGKPPASCHDLGNNTTSVASSSVEDLLINGSMYKYRHPTWGIAQRIPLTRNETIMKSISS